MALKRQAPSTGGFAASAGEPITPPINTRISPSGNSQKRLGGSYRPTNFKNAGPRGKRR